MCLCCSTSWRRDASHILNGTACLISWRRWWRETRRSSAAPRRDSSHPNSSSLSIYGGFTCGRAVFLCFEGYEYTNACFFAKRSCDTSLFDHVCSSLTKEESKRPKYRELLVRQTCVCLNYNLWTYWFYLKRAEFKMHVWLA